MASVLYRATVTTARELETALAEINQMFPRTDHKYLKINGNYVMGIEVVESILTDNSTVQDVHILTEVRNGSDI